MEICSSSPIDPAEIFDTFVKTGAGSVLLHFAVVKPVAAAGGTTESIDYCSIGDSAAELHGIASELVADWPVSGFL